MGLLEQLGDQVTFQGGFDKAPGPYYGTLSGNTIVFEHADGTCNATLKGGAEWKLRISR